MNYLIAKHSEWENNTNRKKTVAEQAIARVRASNTTLLSISRKPRGAVNLDDCIIDYDFVDSDGTLMDLSVRCLNKRDRALNYLTRKIYLRVIQTKSILFLKSMSERGGSDIERF